MFVLSLLLFQSLGSHSFRFRGRDGGLGRQDFLEKWLGGWWEAFALWLAAMVDPMICVDGGASVLGAESSTIMHH